MNDIEKFDLWLMQNSTNSTNVLNDNKDIVIGRLNKNMLYSDINPLSVCVQSKSLGNKSMETIVDMLPNDNYNLNLQYIRRIQETPFYVSYLSGSHFSLKIIDFYSWNPDTIIYRLMIFKKLDYSSKELKEIKCKIDKTSQNKNESDNIFLYYSDNLEMSGNYLKCKTKEDDEIFSIGFAFTFEKNNTPNLQFGALSKTIKMLTDKCKNDHIKKIFITKDRSAEKEIDKLWFKQKYILPDGQIEPDVLENKIKNIPNILFLYEFYEFFNRTHELEKIKKIAINKDNENIKLQYNSYILKDNLNKLPNYKKGIIKDKQFEQPDVLNSLPSNKDLLHYYFSSENRSEIVKDLQLWWNVYSLPLFEKKFKNKYIQNPDEVFLVYFLAIRYNIVWANILFDKIIKTERDAETSTLHHFLFFLSFLFKRISKKQKLNNSLEIIPGYKWDNNYKAVISKNDNILVEYSKFSKKVYTSISKDNIQIFRMDKLCRISFNDFQNNIQIEPGFTITGSNPGDRNNLKLNANDFDITLPLIWRSGELFIFNIRIRWILKKNRFQFTIHSEIEQKIELNDKPYLLTKKDKMVVYQQIKYHPAEIHFNIYDGEGRSIHSKIDHSRKKTLVSGCALSNYGVLSSNVLYKTQSVHKHKLENNDNLQFYHEIPVKFDQSDITFFAKRAQQSNKLEYYNNCFIDKLANLNYREDPFVVIIDPDFRKDLTLVNSYFQNLIEYIPEFIEYENKINIKNNLELFIYLKKTEDSIEGCKWNKQEKKILIINSSTVERALQLFSNFIKINLIRSSILQSSSLDFTSI